MNSVLILIHKCSQSIKKIPKKTVYIPAFSENKRKHMKEKKPIQHHYHLLVLTLVSFLCRICREYLYTQNLQQQYCQACSRSTNFFCQLGKSTPSRKYVSSRDRGSPHCRTLGNQIHHKPFLSSRKYKNCNN